MYSYELSQGCRSNATLDLWRELNTLLYETSVPLLIYEKRYTKGHSNTKPMLGNKTRISNDERDKKNHTLSYSIDIGDKVPIEVTIFKHGVKNAEFIRHKSVIFILNGQTQGIEGKTFISQDLGLTAIRDYTLISVDCTKIKQSFRQDLFMSSRDRLRKGKNYNLLKDKIVSVLKQDENLRSINQEYKGKVLHESKNDKELIEKLFASLKNNKDIINLFKNNIGDFSFLNKKTKKAI